MHPEALAKKAKEFFPALKNFNDFYLAGGTALALQIGHRISVDFDLFNEKEIAATKAYTINRRGSFKDYVDLFFIIREEHSSLEEIIETAEKKYRNEFNSRLFLEQLVYLDDIEDTKIEFLKDRVDKNRIKNFFEEKIKEINL